MATKVGAARIPGEPPESPNAKLAERGDGQQLDRLRDMITVGDSFPAVKSR